MPHGKGLFPQAQEWKLSPPIGLSGKFTKELLHRNFHRSSIAAFGGDATVESLERYSQNQRIIDEFTAHWLAGIRNDLGRLVYVALLRDVSTAHYAHPALAQVYSVAAVHQALLFCHEELFERFLEAPLETQERNLRDWFSTVDAAPADIASRWLEVEFFRLLVPQDTPTYLRDLLLSNLRAILTVVAAEKPATQAHASAQR
jgi:hypothetical protein